MQPKPARLPYDQWLLTQTADQLRERALKKKITEEKKKAQAKRSASFNKRSYNGYRNYRPGTRRAYGRGPYYVEGGLGVDWPSLGIKGNVGGRYESRDYEGRLESVPKIAPVIEGKGPYNVKANSLIGAIDLGMDPPEVRNTNRGEATVFNHREYVADLVSGTFPDGGTSTDFKLQTFKLNAGNPQLFPFLAPIAYQFQEYEVRGMLVELKTLSSDVTDTLSMGAMFMSADYNVLNPPPTTKIQVENMEYSSSSKPSRTMIMPIECERRNIMLEHLMIADDSDYQGTDARTYDLANIYIGSQGIPKAGAFIAEIWVTYEIALFKPLIVNANLPNVLDSIAWHLIGQGATPEKPLGDDFSIVEGSDTRIIAENNVQDDGADIYFPPGIANTYMVVINWVGTVAGAITAAPILPFGSMVLLNEVWSQTTGNHVTYELFTGYPDVTDATHSTSVITLKMEDDGTSEGGIYIAPTATLPGGAKYNDVFIVGYGNSLVEGTPVGLYKEQPKITSHMKEIRDRSLREKKLEAEIKKLLKDNDKDEESSYEEVVMKKKKTPK